MDVLPSCSTTLTPTSGGQYSTVSCSSQVRRSTPAQPRHHHHQRYEATFVQNAVALAVINRLHRWCCQLFWLTIVCVIGCCGDLKELQSAGKQQTLKQMR